MHPFSRPAHPRFDRQALQRPARQPPPSGPSRRRGSRGRARWTRVNLRFHGRVAATFATRIKARNLNAFATPTMSTRVTNIGASDKRFQQEDRTIYFAFPICRPPKTENLATFHCELGAAGAGSAFPICRRQLAALGNIHVCAAPIGSPRIAGGLPISSQMPSQVKSSRVATRWRFLKSKKPPRRTAFQINTDKSVPYLVAGTGFEPVTFRL